MLPACLKTEYQVDDVLLVWALFCAVASVGFYCPRGKKVSTFRADASMFLPFDKYFYRRVLVGCQFV